MIYTQLFTHGAGSWSQEVREKFLAWSKNHDFRDDSVVVREPILPTDDRAFRVWTTEMTGAVGDMRHELRLLDAMGIEACICQEYTEDTESEVPCELYWLTKEKELGSCWATRTGEPLMKWTAALWRHDHPDAVSDAVWRDELNMFERCGILTQQEE